MNLQDFLKLIDRQTKIIIQDKNDKILANGYCRTSASGNIKKNFRELGNRNIYFLYAKNKDIIKIFID